MNTVQTSVHGLILAAPDVGRDAPFALSWFESPSGKETLLLMGNVEHEISIPSLKEEADRINDFLVLEKQHEQLTWMILYEDKTIGAVWLELEGTDHLNAPAVHIMIGDKDYRSRGFGKVIMQEMINYARNNLEAKVLYSRYLVSNEKIAHLTATLGFTKDGAMYKDGDGLEFQNITLTLS
jgi:RimJ/RimL family protein N-acetyltransferase